MDDHCPPLTADCPLPTAHCSLLSAHCFLFFPEHDVFEVCMVGRKAGNADSGEPIAKSSLQKITTYKGGRRRGCNLQGRGVTTFFKHLLGRKWSITFPNHPVVLSGIANAVMQDVAGKFFNMRVRVHLNRFVNVTWLPFAARFLEQAQLPIGIPTAPFYPASLVKRSAGNTITVGKFRLIKFLKFCYCRFELCGNAFVRVETEYPVM